MPSSIAELDHIATCAIVDGVDHAAIEAERKWGVGRLRLLVPVDLRERFDRQAELFDAAVAAGNVTELRLHGPAMERAWRALGAAAEAAGASPLDPEVWEAATGDSDASVIAIVRGNAEAHALLRTDTGLAMQVWTLAEVGRVLGAFGKSVGAVKTEFPGATVTRARMRSEEIDWAVGDRLPDLADSASPADLAMLRSGQNAP